MQVPPASCTEMLPEQSTTSSREGGIRECVPGIPCSVLR